ncbi:metallophosphoesterase [Bacillus luteolus]|uniref:Metallophosphoesterase n=1 Tax=Litchfieldia luteola TaxID=682179 RepID=A0ABR9QP80_9BACI|nr:metallophosphoesterase [Cytobacillus luteolus]MBE4910316.1 metallophosphoesterase [Cytobacillus luteolus]MBP1942109.1 putative MPP superfamily phosphohydrolase [Cytobacillus luteolus]
MLYIYIFLIAIVFLLLYMWIEANKNIVKEQVLLFNDFPKDLEKLTIFFISDIHRRKVSEKLINKVVGKADIVIIGGDLAEKGVSFERISENVDALKGLGPTYFVWGNNDYETDFHRLDSLLLEKGVKILDNTAVNFESRSGEKISLLGVDDMSEERDRLEMALLDAGDNSFKILACHNPRIVKKIKKDHNIKLVLTGHTHGGQIRIMNFGYYEKGKLSDNGVFKLLISNGYGTTGVPLRLGAEPETHLMTLKKS